MAEVEQESSSSQFTIKRLFWTMIVASVAFKLAEMLGFFRMITTTWNRSEGAQSVMLTGLVIIIGSVMMAYIFWIGIRLPWLIERYRSIRQKRQQRRQEFRDQYESLRKEE